MSDHPWYVEWNGIFMPWEDALGNSCLLAILFSVLWIVGFAVFTIFKIVQMAFRKLKGERVSPNPGSSGAPTESSTVVSTKESPSALLAVSFMALVYGSVVCCLGPILGEVKGSLEGKIAILCLVLIIGWALVLLLLRWLSR